MFLERERKLQSLVLTGSGVISRDIPKDTVIKRIQLRLKGGITTTFGSGTPVARADAIFHSLVNSIQVICDGSRFVKNCQPHLLRMQQLMNTGNQSERGSSAAATESNAVTTQGGFVYGTTGQVTTVAESISLPFEFIWSPIEAERMMTWLDTRKLSSCELRLSQNSYSSLLSQANTAPVVFSASTLQVDITLIEAVGVPEGMKFMDFRQSTRDIQFTAQTTAFQVEINRGASLAGLWLYCKDGAAGSSSSATDRLASNLLVTDIVLKLNGSIDLKSTTFAELQAANRSRYGFRADYASNVSPVDGVAHLNFVNKTIRDAVNTAKGVDSLFLYLSTNSGSVVSYTNAAIVTIMTDEIAPIAA